MDLLQAMDASLDLKESVNSIISSSNISLDSPWLDYDVLNASIKQKNVNLAYELLDTGCTVEKFKPTEPTDTPLHNAVKLRDAALVNKLLTKGARIATANLDSNTPLHLAFLLKFYEIVDVILTYVKESSNYDSKSNRDGLTHLHIACARGNAQLVYRFSHTGANFLCVVSNESPNYRGYTCLTFACDSKNLDKVAVVVAAIKLFGNCVDKNKDYSYDVKYFNQVAIRRCHEYRFGMCIDRKKFLSAFQAACFQGDIDEVQSHLEQGEDPNTLMSRDAQACPSFAPLHFALEAPRNRQKIIELLLEKGADVNLRNGFCMTPLHSALYGDGFRQPLKDSTSEQEDGVLEMIYKAVKDKAANPMDAFGLTYFHAAVAVNDLETVKKLIEKGESDCKPILPNSRNFSRFTPLHFAVKYGREEMSRLLVERGADVKANEDDDRFDTPLQTAIRYGRCEMIDFLLARGANAKVATHRTRMTTLHLLVERFGDYEDEKSGLLRSVHTLTRYGADVDAVDSQRRTARRYAHDLKKCELLEALSRTNRRPITSSPLQSAMNMESFRHIRRLLEQSVAGEARMVDQSTGRTLLHQLAERLERSRDEPCERNELARLVDELVVDHGVDVDARDRRGYTALHMACSAPRVHRGLVEKLLDAGADVNLKVDDRTALDLLTRSRHENDEVDDALLSLLHHLLGLTELGLEVNPVDKAFCRSIVNYKQKEKRRRIEENRKMPVPKKKKEKLMWYIAAKLSIDDLEEKEEQRLREIQTLKSDKLTDDVSMYDYVRMDGQEAAAYAENRKVQEMVNEDNANWMYGVYGYRVRAVYRRSLRFL